MAARLPPSLPREVITLVTVLLVIVLVSFPASATHVAVLVLVGGGVFLLLSPLRKRDAAEVQMQRAPDLQSVYLSKLKERKAQESNAQPPAPTSGQRGGSPQRQNPSTEKTPEKQKNLELTSNAKIDVAQIAAGQPPAQATLNEPASSGKAVSSQPAATQSSQPVAVASKPEKKAESSQPNATPSSQPLAGGAAVLARLRQQRALAGKTSKEAEKSALGSEVIVAYASQTGTAQEIAKGIQAESASHGIKSKVMSLNELGFEEVASGRAPLMVVVAASTGDGDAPDNSAKFYATLRRRTQPEGILKGVRFTCLGLGDSNYTRFMGVSRAIRTRMQELGADTFYKMAEADEVDGLESTVDPWIEGLWAALKSEVGNKEGTGKPPAVRENGTAAVANGSAESASELIGVPALAPCRVAIRWLDERTAGAGESAQRSSSEAGTTTADPAGLYTPSEPFWATVASASYLTASTSDRKVLHLELDLAGSGIEYLPGDSLGIMPANEDGLVDALLERLGQDGAKVLEVVSADDAGKTGLLPHLRCPCTLRKALQSGVELASVPRKSLLRLLAEHCTDSGERHRLLHLSSRGGRNEYAALIAPVGPSLLDLLRRFPSCQPPLAALLDALPPLAPRLYSVSSSPLEHPDRAHVAFSVVRIGSPLPNVDIPYPGLDSGPPDPTSPNRWGVATGWLERKVEPLLSGKSESAVRVPVHLRRGGTFGPPQKLSSPVLMIGPGTGVTPFRGFLQHRRRHLEKDAAAAGPAWLYFGCRNPGEDFLYKEDLEGFARDGTLTRLELAFSRKGPEKEYVQHRMRDQAKELYPLLSHPDAFIFVCGDGAKMAKDVHATLVKILGQGAGVSAAEAASQLSAMTKAGRYVRDIWS